jgi:putative ATPase
MIPLASKIRPTTLKEYIGQKHLVDVDKPIGRAIAQKHIFSFILWGPPGVGKTTLARIYAHALDVQYFELSAVSASKDDIKKIIGSGQQSIDQRPKILFLDEIHRFNKAQQDFLLPYVESGELTLIGATTENPSFEVIAPLLSRCKVFVLHELTENDIALVIQRTQIPLDQDAQEWLLRLANGDARQAIALLENTHKLYQHVTLDALQKTVQTNYLRYDKKAEEHYNTISAFIKSMRASDANAALYYLARMIESGEDPKFIARRIVIFASEDIGLADQQALILAEATFRTVEIIGYPECAINLAHATCYLAQAPKNRDSYNAYFEAVDDVKKWGNLPIPLNIRNAPTKLMKNIGYGSGYEMYSKESLLPDKLKNKKYLKQK